MRQITLLVIVITLLTLGNMAYGIDLTDPRQLHDVAHAGGGFAINTISYGLARVILGKEKVGLNLGLALGASALVAAAWEMKPGAKLSGRDFGMSMLGAGASSLTILAFGF